MKPFTTSAKRYPVAATVVGLSDDVGAALRPDDDVLRIRPGALGTRAWLWPRLKYVAVAADAYFHQAEVDLRLTWILGVTVLE